MASDGRPASALVLAERLAIVREGALPIRDAAKYIGVSRSLLYELIAAEGVRTIKIGARRLVPKTELDKLLAQHLEDRRI